MDKEQLQSPKIIWYFRTNVVIHFSQNNFYIAIQDLSYCIFILPLYAISQLHQIVLLLQMPLWPRKVLKLSMWNDFSNNLGIIKQQMHVDIITIYSFTSKQTTKILNATWYVWLIHDTSLKLLLKYSVVKDFSWRRMLLKFPIQCVWFWRKWHIFYETYTLFRPLSNYGNSIITDYTVFHILKPSKCNNYPIFLAEIIS